MPFYSRRVQAALSRTEALTLVADNHIPDDVYNEACRHFSEQELVNLSLAAVAVNGWNRLAIAFRSAVGEYRAGMVAAMTEKA